MGGANGTKADLPVGIEVLIEMAEYCERIYDEGKEIRDNEFSYNVVQDRGVTIVSIRGTNNGRNVLTDLDARPFQDKKLATNAKKAEESLAEVRKETLSSLEELATEISQKIISDLTPVKVTNSVVKKHVSLHAKLQN